VTIYGSPGGTPANTTPFQGTQPGNAVNNTLPGIPPNMSVMAAVSAGLLPVNALFTNLGQPDTRPGRSALETFGMGQGKGVNAKFQSVLGGSANEGPAGGNSLGAGGMNQTNDPGSGESTVAPHNAPATALTVAAQPVYQG
jgi:hypothetical protein